MRKTFVLIVPLSLLLAGTTNLFGDVAYLHTGALWDNNTAASREAAMNTVFGSGNWSDLDFAEVVDSSSIFNSTNTFIFLDGSNNGAYALQSYLTSNLGLIEDWVRNGGHLFLNSAPNEGGNMNFGFGVTLNYSNSTGSSTVTAADDSHAIFNGPYGTTGTEFTGNSFSHATVSGIGLNPLIIATDEDIDPNNNIVLAEMAYGSGHVLFGGMTAAYHQEPQPNVDYLWANIIAYGASPSAIPEPSSYALFAGIATLGLITIRRKR